MSTFALTTTPPDGTSNGAVSSSSSISRDRTTSNLNVEGTIKLAIPNLEQLQRSKKSSVHMIAGLPWRVEVKTECSERTDNVKYFSIFVLCNSDNESPLWSCEADIEYKLLNIRDPADHFILQASKRNFNSKICENNGGWGFPGFIEWSKILDPNKGYIANGQVTVEARIVVRKTRGVRTTPALDFTKPQTHCWSDVVLVVGGARLHVSKAYLATYSTFFSALFFGEFRERNMDEVPLEDAILEEFIELLHVIYPSRKAITAANVECLLELGDKYDISCVIEECGRFLLRTDEIEVIEKLIWADRYQLAGLQDACMKTFKTAAEVKNLSKLKEYDGLSDATKAALLEKIFKLL